MPADRVTAPIRVYRGDKAMITRLARTRMAETNKRVTPADVVRELLAQHQDKERGQ